VIVEFPGGRYGRASEHVDGSSGSGLRRDQGLPDVPGSAVTSQRPGFGASAVPDGHTSGSARSGGTVGDGAVDRRGASDGSAVAAGQDAEGHGAVGAGESVLMIRPRPGVVGESVRVVHIVPVSTLNPEPGRLLAYCGASFLPRYVEMFDFDSAGGMPCNRCQSRARAAMTDVPTVINGETPDAGGGVNPGDAVGNLTRFLRNLAVQLPGFADKIDAGEVTGQRLREFMDILHNAVDLGLVIAVGRPCDCGRISDSTGDHEPAMTPAVGHVDGEWPR
jgi:hypothetical protein